ncbi:MAG: alpha/beta hydrolase [Chloroflexi bacterium]|nr:alpha/beta hydrolase [Chloroflexota bacterium]
MAVAPGAAPQSEYTADNRDIAKALPPPADFRISYGPHPLHYGDLRLPDGPGPHPVVVFVHGGRWRAEYDLQHVSPACAALTAAGVATWNIEFRRVGHIGGGWPGTFEDVGKAADYVREIAGEHNLDLDRLVIAGHSSGGHLALWLAGRASLPPDSPVHTPNPLRGRAVIALAPIADMEEVWADSPDGVEDILGGSPKEFPDRLRGASPAELLPFGMRQVLIQGDHDNRPPSMLENYGARACAAGDEVKVRIIPGAGHFWLVDPGSPCWDEIADAILAEL